MSRTAEYRRFREALHQAHLKRLLNDAGSSFLVPVWWNNNEDRKYLKRVYISRPYYKKQARRAARRIDFAETVTKGNIHQKYYCIG